MDKVAIIVQRCHQSVVGGSETLAWQYATMLKDSYEVDILTTTALDSDGWSNGLPEGPETSEGINVRRFHIDISRNRYGSELLGRLLQNSDRPTNGDVRHLPWPISLQEELIRQLGPYSDSLIQFLRTHWSDYKKIIVFTYLYPTAYFSLLEIPKGRALFVPTLHDEEIAYLSVYKHAARRAKMLIWLTDAERQFGLRLWGDLPGRIVSPAIDTIPRAPFRSSEPYVLYCGRIDAGKGCQELVDYFMKFKEENESTLRLILTGSGRLAIPAHPNIEFRGVASPEEKFSLMSGATIFITPSDKESFSIVTLEAMAQGTPVLVNGASQVLVDHINSSEAGLIYHDYESFSSNLQALLSNAGLRTQLGESGKRYVHSRYTYESVRQTLIEVIETPDWGKHFIRFKEQNAADTEVSPMPGKLIKSRCVTKNSFRQAFTENLGKCDWSPHPLYSVFTQYDRDYYLRQKDDFMHKYRCFYAVSKTISPEKIIEMGTSAGSSADAYLSATPTAEYIGLDVFGVYPPGGNDTEWDPQKIAAQLFKDRGFKNWKLVQADLRGLQRLPGRADLVVVDAAHDFENAYADLRLALTARPSFIFVDDADFENGAKPAIIKFLKEDLKGRVDFTFPLSYFGGGLVIKLTE